MQINIRGLEIRKQKDENFEGVTRDLHQKYGAADVVEVSVEHFPLRVDVVFVVLEGHSWWSLFGHDVDLVFRGDVRESGDR